ncbi:hypothetical protein Glove_801g10 [Diversispora epigaea]|uniref:GOLD domain-containing protein n=1 Tax=Diversispora epigaea TaxID=1348612 RepID=A0A397FYT8_9GLOM|nr:hypothetical protein Glove_801g10 [Diversispora epigaea]
MKNGYAVITKRSYLALISSRCRIVAVHRVVAALAQFDLHASPPDHVIPKCISQYVPTDTLVVVTIKIGTGYNQKIDVEVTDNSDAHNKYGQKRDLDEETRIAFTTHADADISICFINTLDAQFQANPQYHRTIDLDVDVGAEAIDYNQLVKSEKLKPMEAELRKLEQVVQEIVDEMEYLRSREARMRDTNESTNERVQWFSLGTVFIFILLEFQANPQYHRTIDLDVDVGAEAIDYNQLVKSEKLKPMEAELRKLEQVVQEIVDEMEYLRSREARMRDTNESTNERVQWFSLGTVFIFILLGGWQIIYLKKYFQRKRLID